MTPEEKAKRYDEAYKVAEGIHRFSSNPAEIKRLEQIFPELGESEDEKIREHLIQHFRNKSKEDWNGVPVKSVLAWLEKQGKKSISFTFDDVLALQCCMETVKKVQEDKDLYEKLNDLHGRVYNAYQLEKQGKNNMGISEATKKKLEDNLNKALEKETPESWNEFLDERGEQKQDPCEHCKDRCLNCHNFPCIEKRAFEQGKSALEAIKKLDNTNKVEPKFNIGDTIVEKDFDECGYGTIKDIKDEQYIFTDGSGININEQNSWQLVKTSTNIKQTPAWSEEDEVKINRIVACLENLNVADNDILLKDINWLKYLKERYTWKPSEEQIKTCKEVYADILSAKGFNIGTVNSELNRLEEELKKLKG